VSRVRALKVRVYLSESDRERIADFVAPGHLVSWPVTIEGGGKPC